MRRLRVVFSIGAMHGGGSERQVVHLLTHLDLTRFEPLLYLVDQTGPLLESVPSDVPIASFVDRVKPPRIYLPGRMHAQRVNDFAEYLTEVRADVSYDRTFLMTLISAAGAQRVGVPNVSTIVTNPETGFAPVAGRFAWLKRRILRRLYDNSTQVLAVSTGARTSAIRFYGLRGDNVAVHRNGVDVDRIQQDLRVPLINEWWTAPERESVETPVVRIVSAGRLNHEKGFHNLIEAVARLRTEHPSGRYRLAILGDGPHRDRLGEQIRVRQLGDSVRLLGFQSNAMAWIHSADMFVLCSLVEGMPNVLLEAMACGVPVISTDCPSGPREILDGGRLGVLVPINDPAALAEAIQTVATDSTRAHDVAKSALQEVTELWSVASATRNLEHILIAAVEKGRVRTS